MKICTCHTMKEKEMCRETCLPRTLADHLFVTNNAEGHKTVAKPQTKSDFASGVPSAPSIALSGQEERERIEKEHGSLSPEMMRHLSEGRPVKPHRSGGGHPVEPFVDGLTDQEYRDNLGKIITISEMRIDALRDEIDRLRAENAELCRLLARTLIRSPGDIGYSRMRYAPRSTGAASMTDLEITKLCATAMGYIPMDGRGYLLGVIDGSREFQYSPLHDDAQAMALVKKYQLEIRHTNTGYEVRHLRAFATSLNGNYHGALNRAICDCVAKMQASKP